MAENINESEREKAIKGLVDLYTQLPERNFGTPPTVEVVEHSKKIQSYVQENIGVLSDSRTREVLMSHMTKAGIDDANLNGYLGNTYMNEMVRDAIGHWASPSNEGAALARPVASVEDGLARWQPEIGTDRAGRLPDITIPGGIRDDVPSNGQRVIAGPNIGMPQPEWMRPRVVENGPNIGGAFPPQQRVVYPITGEVAHEGHEHNGKESDFTAIFGGERRGITGDPNDIFGRAKPDKVLVDPEGGRPILASEEGRTNIDRQYREMQVGPQTTPQNQFAPLQLDEKDLVSIGEPGVEVPEQAVVGRSLARTAAGNNVVDYSDVLSEARKLIDNDGNRKERNDSAAFNKIVDKLGLGVNKLGEDAASKFATSSTAREFVGKLAALESKEPTAAQKADLEDSARKLGDSFRDKGDEKLASTWKEEKQEKQSLDKKLEQQISAIAENMRASGVGHTQEVSDTTPSAVTIAAAPAVARQHSPSP